MTHLKTILQISVVLCIIVCAVLAIVKMQNRSCSGVQVVIDYKGENEILNETDFIQILNQNKIKTKGEKLKEVKLETIKKVLSDEIYVQKINKIYFSGTKLMIDITLREILLHVFPTQGNQYYIDNEGYMIPFSSKIQEKLIVVNGNINLNFVEKKSITEKKSLLNSIYQIAKLIQVDPFYAQNFKQIFVNKDNIIELVPIDGSLTILFGDENEAEQKLIKLKEIYNNVLPFSADKKYSLIDVRFKNRVIAKKANI
jgi:cell division protein FtsQ